MTQPDSTAIEAFLRRQYDLWNAGNRAEFMALFREMTEKGFTIEYVGSPAQDGWKAMDAIWDAYGGRVTIDVIEILVNGNEAAVHALNHHAEKDGRSDTHPSIEIYRFAGEALQVRYFHRS